MFVNAADMVRHSVVLIHATAAVMVKHALPELSYFPSLLQSWSGTATSLVLMSVNAAVMIRHNYHSCPDSRHCCCHSQTQLPELSYFLSLLQSWSDTITSLVLMSVNAAVMVRHSYQSCPDFCHRCSHGQTQLPVLP